MLPFFFKSPLTSTHPSAIVSETVAAASIRSSSSPLTDVAGSLNIELLAVFD
jgi:hypothetical protein